jgi:hypothetical protein
MSYFLALAGFCRVRIVVVSEGVVVGVAAWPMCASHDRPMEATIEEKGREDLPRSHPHIIVMIKLLVER